MDPSLNRHAEKRLKGLLRRDPYLAPYAEILRRRIRRVTETELRLTEGNQSLSEVASGHEYFGLHKTDSGWVFREWAPNATSVFLVGEFSQWREGASFALKLVSSEGVWEITLSPAFFKHGDLYRLRLHWPGGEGDRVPVYARMVHQDPETFIFNAVVRDLPPYCLAASRCRSPGRGTPGV